jgi:hypothetical protein
MCGNSSQGYEAMNKTEEAKLASTAREAQHLRETINRTESMLRSWARRKSTVKAGDIYISLSDRRQPNWHVGVNLPAELVQSELVPTLKRIKKAAVEQLQALALP